MPVAHVLGRRVTPATYVELVRSLLETLVPAAIMSALFVVTALTCAARSPSRPLFATTLFGVAASVVRLLLTIALRWALRDKELDVESAKRTEWLFAGSYLAFASAVGMFCALCLRQCPTDEHMVIAALAVGYAAGVAAGVSLRPWIAIPAILLAVVPAIFASALIGDTPHHLLALILLALTAGGIISMVGRYRTAIEMIEMRQRFASLARRDPLTGLANRLALDEAFASAAKARESSGVVLHYFDLDRFKPINDAHGHAVGDLLLQAVADRLRNLIRAGDLAIRLGGDEFAVLQTKVSHAQQAELIARRIVRVIAQPYEIGGRRLEIGVSLGSASGAPHGAHLNDMLLAADRELYRVKHGERPVRALAS